MNVFKIALVAGFTVSAVGVFAQAGGPRRDGNWEMTVEMQMPNMPAGMKMPPMKSTQCITKEDAADPNKTVPSRPERGGPPSDCKVSDYKVSGNKVTYNITCTGAQPMTGTAEFVYEAETVNGTMIMNMSMERGGTPMPMTMKYSGKRLGDCLKK
jgi:Protein of unknown function (DUF3617)